MGFLMARRIPLPVRAFSQAKITSIFESTNTARRRLSRCIESASSKCAEGFHKVRLLLQMRILMHMCLHGV